MARMSGLMAAAGLAFINTVGLLGGFVGPYLYGWAEDSMGDTGAGYVSFVAFSVVGVLLLPLLRRTVDREDATAAADLASPRRRVAPRLCPQAGREQGESVAVTRALETKYRIAETAMQLFLDQGYESVTVEAVADASRGVAADGLPLLRGQG